MYLLSSVFCCCVSHKENQSFEWQQWGRLWERLMFPTPVFLFAQGKHCAIHNVLYLFISPPNIRFSSLIFSEGVFRSTATVDSFTEKQCVWWQENWWVLPLACTSTPTPGLHIDTTDDFDKWWQERQWLLAFTPSPCETWVWYCWLLLMRVDADYSNADDDKKDIDC